MIPPDPLDVFIEMIKRVVIPTAIISVIIFFITNNVIVWTVITCASVVVFSAIWIVPILIYCLKQEKEFRQQ